MLNILPNMPNVIFKKYFALYIAFFCSYLLFAAPVSSVPKLDGSLTIIMSSV